MIETIIMTLLVYGIANSFSIKIGTTVASEEPLYDVLHEFLPDLSKVAYIRDIVLIVLFVPLFSMKLEWSWIYDLIEQFQIVILIKAICIFFTYIPSSNTECSKKLQLNHCHHNSTSGHAALCTLLGLLYLKCGVPVEFVFFGVLFYCLLIIITRAHYTTDVWQGVIISLLIGF